ncbi:MAG: gliding motility-associated C-terminal domain-containing protein, partial [Phaeodactylibacter sp.]|nr:gliding motility-associated C-terminal domain-containing protein [Phaeodactylibacter sp.]
TLTAFNGCDSLLLLDLSILPPPTPEIVPNGHFCTDDSIELSAGTFTGYHWSLNSLSTSSINVTTPGIYSLTVTDVNGCSASTSLDVPAPETLGVQYTVDPIACFGESTAQITITGITGGQAPYYYALNNGSPQTVPVFESLSSGNFLLQVMDANGCTGSSQIQIDNPAPLYLYVREDTVVQLGNPILLKAVTNIVNPSVHWTPETSLSCSNCLSTMAAPSTTTTYSVVVTNAQGCQIAEEVTINVNDELRIYTPNALSPNGDGVNDCFFLQSNFDYLLLELSIFDRWGNLVFQQHDLPINDPAAGWCGRSDQSEPTIPGNFVWLAKVQNLNGEVVVLKGGITLLR